MTVSPRAIVDGGVGRLRLSKFSVSKLARRQWTWIVAILVVALVVFTVDRLHGIFGSNNEISRPGSDALENTGYNPKQVLFEVFGSPGSVATINYLDIHAQPQHVDNVPLPWSQNLTTDDPTMYADLRAQGDGGTAGCRITVNGIVKDERSTDNVNGYIACLDKTA
jgi:Mycobacterium membrane protein